MRPVREGDVLRVLGVDVEFRRPGPSIREVSVRCTAEPPRMSIVPLAGNVLVVEVGSGLPSRGELEVMLGEAAVVDREFSFEGLQLRFEPGDRAGVRITFTATLAGPIGADGTVLTTSMVVQPRAMNLISVLAREVRGQVIS